MSRALNAALAGTALTVAALPAAAQEGPLRLAMHYAPDQAAPILACLDRYEAETGQGVEYQQISYSDYLQTVLTGRLAGQAPDIYNIYSIWGAQMADNGILAEPPAEIVDYVREAYAEGTVEAASIDGTLYGIPTEVSVYMLVSNMDLLREAGFDEPPTDWAGVLEVGRAVATRNDQGRLANAGFAYGDSVAGSVHPFYALLLSRGAPIYEEGFAAANFDSPEAEAALADMAATVSEGITSDAVDAFDFPAGGIGMMIMANWFEADLRAGFGDRFDEAVRVSQIPAGEDWRTLQYAFFMGVDSASPRQEAAWELVRWMNGPESASTEGGPSCMGEMLGALGALTANAADTAALPAPDGFTAPFAEALASGRAVTQPNVMQASEIEGLAAIAIDTAMAGEEAPGEALRELDAEVEGILAEFY